MLQPVHAINSLQEDPGFLEETQHAQQQNKFTQILETDPKVVSRHIKSILAYKEKAFLLAGEALHSLPTPHLDETRELALSCQLDDACQAQTGTLYMRGYNRLYAFPITKIVQSDHELLMAMPTTMLAQQQRQSARVSLSDKILGYAALPDRKLRLQLNDISLTGVSCQLLDEETTLPKRFQLVLEFPLTSPLHFNSEIKHSTSPTPRSWTPRSGDAYGISVVPRDEETRQQWLRVLNRYLHPSTRNGNTPLEEFWDLFVDSGFLSLSGKTPLEFQWIKEEFRDVSRALELHPHLGCQTVWPSSNGIEGTVSHVRGFSHTWLIYQLAKRRGRTPEGESGREVLRKLFQRCFEHPKQYDQQFRWVIGYTEADVSWNKGMLVDFADQYASQDLGFTKEFVMTQASTRATLAHRDSKARHWTVSPATDKELSEVLARLEKIRPIAYREALDLTPDRFHLKDLCEQWRAAGMERKREMFVAKRAGQIRACMLVDAAQPGTSLFQLLDGVRLYTLSSRGQVSYPFLLEEARRWYRDLGREQFLYFMEDINRALIEKADLRDLGDGYFLVLSQEIINNLLEHIHVLSAPSGKSRTRPKPA